MAVKSIVKVSELEGARRLDAEHYHPKYIEVLNALQNFAAVPLASMVESAKRRFKPVADQPFQYIEISEVNTSTGDMNPIPILGKEAPDRAQWIVRKGDVIISTVRPIRNAVGIVTDLEDGFVCSSGFAVVTAKQIAPEFLFMFLKARPIVELLDRKTSATMYPAVSWQDVLSLPIFKPDRSLEELIIARVRDAQQSLRRSKSPYRAAEQILLDELRWDKLYLSQPRSYAIPLSQAKDVNRIDAEHFQPKYDKLLAHIKGVGKTDILGDVVLFNKRGLQPTYVEGGEVIVVNSQHLGRYLLNVEATERTDEDFWRNNKRSQLKTNDVLVYSTGAYVGRTNVWLEDSKAIASNHVNIIRPSKGYNALYLACYLNSLLGLWQAEKWASGSGQRELYPDDIARFVLYRAPQQFQEKIADLVFQSYQARQKATELLEEAKRKVEDMIEKATSG